MARDGSGNYSLPEAAFVAGTVANSTAVNSDFSDIATALTASIAKDGQTTPTADLPMGGYNHTGLGAASAASDSISLGQVQAEAFVWCGTAGGTADAITLSPSPAITAYAAGQRFVWYAGASPNTGAMTVAISGLAAKTVLSDGVMTAGAHAANKLYMGIYDGTNFQITHIAISKFDSLVDDTSPQLGGDLDLNGNNIDFPTTANISDCLDEDSMSSDSATALATQQSIKAYVDSGDASSITLMTPVTVSSTSVDFTIPSGVKKVTVMFSGVSTNGTGHYLIQIGDSGGVETTGYLSTAEGGGLAAAATTGFIVFRTPAAADTHSGAVDLYLANSSSNTWVAKGLLTTDGGLVFIDTSTGKKSLSGELTTVRITSVGPNTLDAGELNVQYES